MIQNKTSECQTFVLLKHMELSPQILTIPPSTSFSIKISKNNTSLLSQCSQNTRKFLFLLEQTDEETPPLSEGEEYLFTVPLTEEGSYHLQCLNYTKIKSKIEVAFPSSDQSEKVEISLEPKITISSSQLQNVAEVQQEKQEETKEEAAERPLENSHSKSDYAEFEKILNDDQLQYDIMPNKYLKYFKEQFKLWRDFFQYEPEKPQKEKYGSQGPEKFSSSSLSVSEVQSQKEKSVISHLRSHQEISDINEDQLQKSKTMKKTNSEYCFNADREVQKTHVSSNSKRRPFHTNTSSPVQRTEHSQTETFLDWACIWSAEQGFDEILLKKKGDKHLMKQWFSYLHNKFKITQFMYG